jgi:RND family efflux transporter MFP subunit
MSGFAGKLRPLFAIAMLLVGVAAGVLLRGPLGEWMHQREHAQAEASGQLWTCGMHPQVIQDKPGVCPICSMTLVPINAGAATDSNIHIDPVMVQNMGVRVARVGTGRLTHAARVVGVLQEAQPNIREVSLRVSGWVEKLHANTEGMHLMKGDPLFDLYSPEIRVAIQEVSTARRSLEGLTANADQGTRQSSESFLAAAKEKLLLWGLEAEEIERLAALPKTPRTVTFRSPISGHLVEKTLVEGAMVKAGERAMRIVDHSTLWLDMQVHAQDLPLVKMGQKLSATIESQPGKTFEGHVIFIHPHIDVVTRTATVRVALPNPDMSLRPGMYATAHISATLAEDALLVPREAVIDTGDRQIAFVSTRSGEFEPRTVKVGVSSSEGEVQVLEGLKAGEMVVTSGQFLLDSESRMREAIQKHLRDKLLKQPGKQGEPDRPVIAATSRSVSPEWRAAVDQVVSEYLKLSRRLGEVERGKEPVEATALEAATKKLVLAAGDSWQKSAASELVRAAAALEKLSLDRQREAFKSLSNDVIALIDRNPPSSAVAPNLYVLYCSMENGYWVQDTDQKANPYYATKMKTCAELKRTIASGGNARG